MTISLAFLAPDLVKAAIDGRLPHGMGVARLCDLPAEWSRQRQMLGLPHTIRTESLLTTVSGSGKRDFRGQRQSAEIATRTIRSASQRRARSYETPPIAGLCDQPTGNLRKP